MSFLRQFLRLAPFTMRHRQSTTGYIGPADSDESDLPPGQKKSLPPSHKESMHAITPLLQQSQCLRMQNYFAAGSEFKSHMGDITKRAVRCNPVSRSSITCENMHQKRKKYRIGWGALGKWNFCGHLAKWKFGSFAYFLIFLLIFKWSITSISLSKV